MACSGSDKGLIRLREAEGKFRVAYLRYAVKCGYALTTSSKTTGLQDSIIYTLIIIDPLKMIEARANLAL